MGDRGEQRPELRGRRPGDMASSHSCPSFPARPSCRHTRRGAFARLGPPGSILLQDGGGEDRGLRVPAARAASPVTSPAFSHVISRIQRGHPSGPPGAGGVAVGVAAGGAVPSAAPSGLE